LIVNAAILLHRDLRMTFSSKAQRFLIFVFWFVVYIGALLPFYVITNFLGVFGEDTPAQNFLTRLLETPTAFMAAGLSLSALCLLVFMKRKSYAYS
jgi:F0F1-type ATP synthase membrane subunit a